MEVIANMVAIIFPFINVSDQPTINLKLAQFCQLYSKKSGKTKKTHTFLQYNSS